MIKKIIVALDPDTDTRVATRYAVEIAGRTDAQVTGLAVVDTDSIDSSARGGGIGSFYYAEKLKEKLTDDTRKIASELLQSFENDVAESGVEFADRIEEGVPFERIVEDLKFHDFLVMGRDPHFFYAHPDKDTQTLARIVKNTIGPTLVVGSSYRKIKTVMIAYDGSPAASRVVQRLAQLRPFGDDIDVTVLNVHHNHEDESKLLLTLVGKYLAAHGIEAKTISRDSRKPQDEILKLSEEIDADVLVAGAHAVSAVSKLAFGSTTSNLLKNCAIPMLLDS